MELISLFVFLAGAGVFVIAGAEDYRTYKVSDAWSALGWLILGIAASIQPDIGAKSITLFAELFLVNIIYVNVRKKYNLVHLNKILMGFADVLLFPVFYGMALFSGLPVFWIYGCIGVPCLAFSIKDGVWGKSPGITIAAVAYLLMAVAVILIS